MAGRAEPGDAAATLPALLDAATARACDRPALIWNDREIGYAAFRDATLRMAGGLAAAGIGPGDRVAIWMPNSPDWLALAYACWRVGAAIVVVNVKASEADLADILLRSDAAALACHPHHPGSRFAETLAGALGSGATGRCRLLIGAGDLAGLDLPKDWRIAAIDDLGAASALPSEQCGPDDEAVIFTTSGSTGKAKLVVHAQRGLAAHAGDIVRRFGLDAPDAVQFLPLALAGAYGAVQSFASLASGRPMVMMEAFEPEIAADLILRHGVTGFCAFDELIDRVMAARGGERPFPTLGWCGFGIFNPSLATFVEDTERRGIRLVGLYGSSESQPFFAAQHRDVPAEQRHVDGGPLLSQEARFRIRDIDTGELLGPGRTGEIEIAGPGVFRHYLGDAAANAAQFCPDGFFKTGDSGRIGPDGSLVFEARMQDVLRISGYLVAARDIEIVVARLPGIARCQVVGLTTREGTRPVAFVVPSTPDAELDQDALREACAAKLARYKVPVAFHAVPDFPMTGSVNAPKVNRRRLAEMAAERLADRAA